MPPATGSTGTRVAPSATFVRHSPGCATRLTAPITSPPATTTRRSWPSGGTSSCATAPDAANHGRARGSLRARGGSVARRAQSTTSRPQLPKRGLSDERERATAAGASARRGRRVRGCGSAAAASALAVASLSCASAKRERRIEHGRRRGARAARAAPSPGSMPSSVGANVEAAERRVAGTSSSCTACVGCDDEASSAARRSVREAEIRAASRGCVTMAILTTEYGAASTPVRGGVEAVNEWLPGG